MLREVFAGFLSALLLLPGVPSELQVREPELAAGIVLAQEGDFGAALARLDGAVRRLETGPRPSPELAVGYVYLGMTYLEQDQEPSARMRFLQAAREDPALRLNARDFSAQVIRFFEAARQEVDATRAAPAVLQPAATPSPEPRKKRSALPFVILGGAAVGGIAATTFSTTTATTTTTTLPPASCSYSMSPATQKASAAGGNGTCSVRATPSGCGWTAESTEAWLSITGEAQGTGNGTVSFRAAANEGNGRKARIRLAQDHDARCEIEQDSSRAALPPAGAFIWSSELEVPGSGGQIVVNGLEAAYQNGGRIQRSGPVREPRGQIEATLVTASGRPGTWRFTLSGAFQPGSLRVSVGDAVTITADAVAFRLAGRAGERVVFGFGLSAP